VAPGPVVEGPPDPCEAVDHQDHVPPALQLGLHVCEDQSGQVHVLVRRVVARARHDLHPLDRAAEVRDLLGPLVDQEHEDPDVRAVLVDGPGHLLQDYGLAGPRGGHDQLACALADGRDQVHDPHTRVAPGPEVEPAMGVHRDQVVEPRAGVELLGRQPAECFDGHQPMSAALPLELARDGCPLGQTEPMEQRGVHRDLLGRGPVRMLGRANGEDLVFGQLENSLNHIFHRTYHQK